MKVVLRLLLCVAICTSLATLASADTCTGTFTSILNVSDNDGTGPFGTVCVTLTSSNTATITFAAATGFVFGDSGMIDANINASSFTIGSISESPNPGLATVSSPPGTKNINGFGLFNTVIENPNFSPGDRETTVSFLVTDTSGNFSSAADVLLLNAKGFDAAAHVYCSTDACNGLTFFVGEDNGTHTPPPTPEPASLVLLGSGLLGLGGFARKHIRRL